MSLNPVLSFGRKELQLNEDPESQEFRAILSKVFRSYFRSRISEAVRKSLHEKARSGRWVGRVPFGYLKDAQGKLIPSDQVSVVREAFTLYRGGQSLAQIAEQLNKGGLRTQNGMAFSYRAVYRMLRNPVYRGSVSIRGTEYPDSHTPIVSKRLWNAVVAIHRSRASR
ncbi:recombinase family protein [Oscillochloris sp. ZM17-4]|uniref:recombinase family protein n=1 Tax=Oscillochloris sp. ZM17-4 TaxID=2866714 RepID=UPI001C73BE5A|nr:recombinase family protein [Oscillochloris sp. ZM17-4]MBX0331020.1 recombinase family protein [Oscillochloris sp. ZM17-4]